MLTIKDAIIKQRIRKFKSDPIPPEYIMELIKSANWHLPVAMHNLGVLRS
jgi:hypothetical protein